MQSKSSTDYVKIPTDGADVWEIDASLLKFESRVGSGSFGIKAHTAVTIKVLKPDLVNKDMLREFAQEVFIMRDLKTANPLMDENEVVKVAEFGVSRVQAQSGVMTAETGAYRWMAPEVIEHKPYDHKADIFSFGIVLWELLTGEGLRPTIPKHTHPKFAERLEKCWQQNSTLRPNFSEIIEILKQISKEVGHLSGISSVH
ncbi:hypothetical protein ACSBR2_020252 [Camellia fascicularis]